MNINIDAVIRNGLIEGYVWLSRPGRDSPAQFTTETALGALMSGAAVPLRKEERWKAVCMAEVFAESVAAGETRFHGVDAEGYVLWIGNHLAPPTNRPQGPNDAHQHN